MRDSLPARHHLPLRFWRLVWGNPGALARAAGFERGERGGGRVRGSPWTVPQRAFFVPLAHVGAAWAWARAHRVFVDVLLHPNTGCMHDDHSLRARWVLGAASKADPAIEVLEFPCNVPTTGCQDKDWPGPPSCGCSTPLKSDAPGDSCRNCKVDYHV